MSTPDMPLPSHVVFARHGRHAHNVSLEQTGEAALQVKPMTLREHHLSAIDEVGRRQAKQLGIYLRTFTSLDERQVTMCSDFRRTYTTGMTALPELSHFIPTTVLRERSWGEIGDIPGIQFRTNWPEEAIAWNEDPLDWLPPGGETLREKALAIQALLTTMGEVAPDKTFLAFTSGEAAVATLVAPLLGRMGKAALMGTYPNGWQIYEMHNGQTIEYTRSNPLDPDEPLRPNYTWMRSTRAGESDAQSTGWMNIDELGIDSSLALVAPRDHDLEELDY